MNEDQIKSNLTFIKIKFVVIDSNAHWRKAQQMSCYIKTHPNNEINMKQ